MGICKRAFLYLTRKYVRSVLLFILFFSGGLFLMTGFAVEEGAKEAAGEFRKSLTAGITIDWRMRMDLDSFVEFSTNEKGESVARMKLPMMKEEYIDDFLAIDGACGFYRNADWAELYTGLTLHPAFQTRLYLLSIGELEGETEDDRVYAENMKTIKKEEPAKYQEELQSLETGMHANRFITVYDSKWHPAFVNGATELIHGRHVQLGDEKKTVISEEMAEQNGLKVGDSISASNYDYITGERYGSTFEMEIVGIFRINFEQKTTEWTYEDDMLTNTCFCTWDLAYWSQVEYNTHNKRIVIAKESEPNIGQMVLFVEDPALLDSVKEQLLQFDAIDWDNYEIGVYDEDYQAVAAPLLAMTKLSHIMIAALTAGILAILSLVLSLWFRGRRQEAGILVSIGVKKKDMLLQFLLESCTVAVLAFFTAACLAGPVSGQIGEKLQAVVEASYGNGAYDVNIEEGTQAMLIHKQPVKGTAVVYDVSPKQMCAVCLLLAATAILSTWISFGQIRKAKPLEILGR